VLPHEGQKFEQLGICGECKQDGGCFCGLFALDRNFIAISYGGCIAWNLFDPRFELGYRGNFGNVHQYVDDLLQGWLLSDKAALC
jgi:hypothetical protein